MNSHVSAILLGVMDMERSKRFYADGLGWKVKQDFKISVFFVPHGGSLVGFYGRDGLAESVGLSPDGNGSGFSGIVFNYVVRSGARVDEVIAEAKKAGAKILKPAARGERAVGRVRRSLRRPGWLCLADRVQRGGKGSAVRRVARLSKFEGP